MKKRTLYTIALALGFSTAWAQQIPLYSNYFFTPYIFNPALSGSEGVTEAAAIHRRQWSGIDGAPETSALALNGALNRQKVGYSIYAFSDQTDILKKIGFYGSYAYHLRLSDNSTLSFGLSAGYLNNTIDQGATRIKDISDPLLATNLNNGGKLDLSAGINLKIANFTIGGAAPQLLGGDVDYAKNLPQDVKFQLIRHYLINTRYDFKFSGDKMVLSPFIFARAADGVPFQAEGGLMFNMKDIGYIGGAYRQNFGVAANIGVHLTDQLTVGYAHDFSTNTYATALGSTSEFMLTYRFGSNDRNERLENEIKKLKQKQREMQENNEEMVNEKLEEFKREMEAKNEKMLEEQKEELAKQQAQNPQNQNQGGGTGGVVPGGGQGTQTGGNQTGGTQGGTQNVQPNTSNIKGYGNENYARNVQPGSPGYYVVAGVFGNENNAQKLQRRLEGQGVEARYFQDRSNNMFYVYVLKFPNYEQADQAKESNLNGQYNGKLWIKVIE